MEWGNGRELQQFIAVAAQNVSVLGWELKTPRYLYISMT
jgi:hypothetical protein